MRPGKLVSVWIWKKKGTKRTRGNEKAFARVNYCSRENQGEVNVELESYWSKNGEQIDISRIREDKKFRAE